MPPHLPRVAACVLALVLMLTAGAAPALAAKKAKCPRGTIPVLKGPGAKAKLVKARGRVRCAKPSKPRKKGFAKPSKSPRGQLAITADQLGQALAVNPAAFATVGARIGAARTRALTDLALRSWRRRASAARARSAADDGGLHLSQDFGDGKGPSGHFALDAAEVTAGGKLGLKAAATLELGVTADGLKDIASGALPPGTSAKAKVEVSFDDAPVACPTASGKVAGKLLGKAKVTLTITGPDGKTETQFASADLDVAYQLTVGEDARWETIDNVDSKTAFAYGGSGKGTETWRGRRVGGGFGQKGVLSGNFDAGIQEAYTHFDRTHGGIFGPHTGIKYSTGPTAWDIQSISNLKGLIVTQIATDYLTLAAIEYVRGVVAPRLQKHWYDDEACLRLDAKPAAAAKLKAGQTTKVTAKNAKAADGTPVKTSQTASGQASLKPGSATVGPGASFDYTLTAPNATPTHSTWKVVALSRAGKKTVDGSLGDQPGYEVTLDDHETGNFATHSGTGRLVATLRLEPVAQSDPAKWTATGTLVWSEVTSMSKVDICTLIDPLSNGAWTVTATQSGPDTIKIDLDFSADTRILWTTHCVPPPPDMPFDTPGMPTVNVLALQPLTFTVPATGGVQALAGEVVDGADGFRTSGTLTVTPVG